MDKHEEIYYTLAYIRHGVTEYLFKSHTVTITCIRRSRKNLQCKEHKLYYNNHKEEQ